MKKRYATVGIGEVKPYPGNARRGDIDGIRGSLRENDQYKDITVQESTGYIIAGNHTWLSAQAEGRLTIDVAYIDVDDERARKINLVDNKTNDDATYDPNELARMLEALNGDYTGTGFDQTDLDKMLDKLQGRDAKADNLPPLPVESNIEPGTIYALGKHRLMCGDITDFEALKTLMDGDMADLIVTSPPYNQGLDGFKASGMRKEHPAWVERMASSYEDSMPEPDYQAQQLGVLDSLLEVTRKGGSMFYNHKIRYREKAILTPYDWLKESGWAIRQEIVWDRQTGIALNARMFIPADERIYWLTKPGADFYFANTVEVKSYTSVWDITPRAEVQMSAPFPVEVPRRCIEACSERDQLVLEPYSGSGTTMIACQELDRVCYGMEINPTYFMASVNRWEAFTGKNAERIA